MYNLKNVKNTYGGVLLLVKLQAEACTYKQGNDINQRLFDKIQQAPELLPVTLLLI